MLYKKLIEDNLSDKIILNYRSEHYSYRELNDRALALGYEWIKNGVKPGDRVIIDCRDKSDTMIALLACLAYGIVFIPIEADNDNKEYIKENSGAVLIYRGGGAQQLLPEKRQILPLETLGYIIYTSGSTGVPKGVVAPLSTIMFCIDAINARLKNDENDRILSRLPLSFDYGLYQVFFSLRFRAELTLVDGDVLIAQVPMLCRQMKITAMPVVPSMLSVLYQMHLLKKEYFPDLRYICSTGEVLSVELIKHVHELLPDVEIIPMYGLTECKRVSVMPPGRWDKILNGSCGIPLDGVKVGFLGSNHNEGELIVYGPNVMNGYWRGGSVDNEVFCIDESGQRFLRTGDYFRIDEDGYLYFLYRIKNIIKVGGYAVSPAEIEVRLKSIKGVISVCVIGIPDEITGESICACVHTQTEEVKEKIEEISRSLPAYKRISRIVLFDNGFPLNKNGKIDMGLLKGYVNG